MDRIRSIVGHGLRGSSTLELALILPVCLGVFMGIIYLCFFRYDQAVCKAACCEAVFAAAKGENMAGVGRAEEWLKNAVVAVGDIQMRVWEENGKFYAEAQGRMKVPFLPVVFSLAAESEAEVVHPTEMIRNTRRVQSLAK